MKKLGLLLAIFLMSVTACYAANIKVTAINQISTKSPNEIIKVQVVETIQLSESFILKEGTVLEGKMVDVIPPKRLKKNSTFSFIPQKYTVDGKTTIISESYKGKYSPIVDFDKGKLATSAALSIGNKFVKGLSSGFYAVKGAVKNEKNNVIVSACDSVYQNSPLSSIEKGVDTVVAPNTMFTFIFPDDKKQKDSTK